jgi:glucose-6-phosphate 1-dehydrogenase
VAPDSGVETYVAARFAIDTWRWAGVPFLIRAGKRLPVTATEVVVEFHRPPLELFGELVPRHSNHLRVRLDPDLRVALGLRVKVPGERLAGEDVELVAQELPPPGWPPYERLLGDALEGDGELFARADTVRAQWRIVEPVLGDVTPLHEYEPGTWGPDEAVRLLADGGWFDPS